MVDWITMDYELLDVTDKEYYKFELLLMGILCPMTY